MNNPRVIKGIPRNRLLGRYSIEDFATLPHIVIISAVFSDFKFAGGKQLGDARASKPGRFSTELKIEVGKREVRNLLI